jgi:formyl-CoA transferase
MTDGNHIFSGLKVLDLASFIAGPAATTILADFGAEVVKVEPPGTGDPYRFFSATPPNPVCDFNYAWQLTNRNKRSIALADVRARITTGVHEEIKSRTVRILPHTAWSPRATARRGLTLSSASAAGHED